MGELAGVEVRRIGEIADRKQIPSTALNSQVIDFACDFGFFTSGKAGGGHYRKGYTRQAIAALFRLALGVWWRVDQHGGSLIGSVDFAAM